MKNLFCCNTNILPVNLIIQDCFIMYSSVIFEQFISLNVFLSPIITFSLVLLVMKMMVVVVETRKDTKMNSDQVSK